MGGRKEGQSQRPKDTPFRQQKLKAWRPILTPKLTIALYVSVGVLFVPIGISVISAADSVVEVESDDYGTTCCIANCEDKHDPLRVDANPCNVTITVTEKMEKPVYMYYKMENYYQNHRRYVKSRSAMQLHGDVVVAPGEKCGVTSSEHPDGNEDDCSSDLCEKRVVVKGCVAENRSSCLINPCGFVAASLFNDSFQLFGPSYSPVTSIVSTGVAWSTDIEQKFNNEASGNTGLNFPPFYHERRTGCNAPTWPKNDQTAEKRAACIAANVSEAGLCFPGSGYCNEDEHFIVWMRTAALPTFRKLYAKIDADLLPGTYTVRVTNGVWGGAAYPYYFNPQLSGSFYDDANTPPTPQTALYPVHSFDGKKRILLSTTSWIGGKNGFLGWAYLVVGVVCLVLALAFAIKMQMAPREPGDASFVAKNK